MRRRGVYAAGAMGTTAGRLRGVESSVAKVQGEFAGRTRVHRLQLPDRGMLVPGTKAQTITLEQYRFAHGLAALAGH